MDVQTYGDSFSDEEAIWELKYLKDGVVLSLHSVNNRIEIVLNDEEMIQLIRKLSVPESRPARK